MNRPLERILRAIKSSDYRLPAIRLPSWTPAPRAGGRRNAAAGLSALCALCVHGAQSAETAAYTITKSIQLGSPERWDYLSFDNASHRVYVAHGTEITVVDGRSGEVVGRVGGLVGVNGVAIVPKIGKGYTDSRAKKAGIVFDLETLKVIKEVPADSGTDAVIYDSASKRVFIMNGSSHSITAIDTATDTVAATIALAGVPEFAVADGNGNLYVNLADIREISRINTRSARVTARWPISECDHPHGLSMDSRTERLFSSCLNGKLLVVDSNVGHIVATLPIGQGSDATAFDPKTRLVFSSNGEGTLSVIREEGPEKYVSLGDIRTQPLARTMTVDPQTGRLYLVTADKVESGSNSAGSAGPPGVLPGSVTLLFLDRP